jgi:pilus assembly protein CpaD
MTSSTLIPKENTGLFGAGRACRRTTYVTAILTFAAAAAGCADLERDRYATGAIASDYRTRHPIVINQAELVADIIVSTNARKLSHRDRLVAASFVSRFKRSGARTIAILIPNGSDNEAAAKRIAHQIVKILGEEGIGEHQIQIQHYGASGHGEAATVRLVYSDISASVPSQCGQWLEDVLDDTQNLNYENFGCATQRNLAAIVADPADLIGPRGETEIDATRRTKVIEDWRLDGSGEAPRLF